MPRTARVAAGGLVYHVLNRGNGRAEFFHKPADYQAFEKLMREAKDRVPMRVLGYCLMPNHWHLVLWPESDGDLSAYMGWLSNTHVHRYRQHYHDVGSGHLYQGRFKSFPIQADEHLLTVLRYVEANPLRAALARSAAGWRWCSFARRQAADAHELLSEWPVPVPPDWRELVEARCAEQDLGALRLSIERGRPFGRDDWVERTADLLGLANTLRPPGRPRKHPVGPCTQTTA